MKLTITARKMTVNQSFNDYAEKKLSQKLDRFFGDGADAKITMSEHKNIITLEVTVKHDGLLFRAEQKATDKNDALDACIDRLIRQIRKNKTRVEKKLHDSSFREAFDDIVEEQVDFEVIKRKRFPMRPMNTDEAILQMNMLGHSFFMFKNGDTGQINVVYKRDDGNYALLEPENG